LIPEATSVIREYRPADCEAVLDVWARASALAHPFLSPQFLALERHTIRTVHLLRAQTWVWEADGHVVGFISLLVNEVGAVFVDPAHHRGGIGRALMQRAQALHGDLEVEVFERNALGRSFYASLGFELEQREMHDATGFEVLRLRLACDPAVPAGGGG
jgi:putative acetyltransferase